MKLTLASLSPRTRAKSEAADRLTADYSARAARYVPTESVTYVSEEAFFAALERQPGRPSGRTAAHLILLDNLGKQLTSEEFAHTLGQLRDTGIQRVVLAIGPADGWSPAARDRAHLLLSLGRITLPHELARAVLAEQIYRALTILAGHPYHSGH